MDRVDKNVEQVAEELRELREKVREVEAYLQNKINNCYVGDGHQWGRVVAYEDCIRKLRATQGSLMGENMGESMGESEERK